MTAPSLIGTYQLGWRYVDVIACPDETGGSFCWMPDGNERSRIRVGFNYSAGEIETVFAILVHEALEALIEDQNCRFRPTSTFVRCASDVYVFHFDHNQFTDIAAKLGVFLWEIREDFKAAFELVHEESE